MKKQLPSNLLLISILILFFISCSTPTKHIKQNEEITTQPKEILDTPSTEKIHLAIVGDIMAHESQLRAAFNPDCQCYEFDRTFSPVRELLRKPDILIGNLETTLVDEETGYRGYPRFSSPDNLAVTLKKFGFDILTLANNHSMDSEIEGLKRTLDVIDNLGMKRVGTYANYIDWEQNRILFVKKKGFKFALLNYTYGTNGIPAPEIHNVNLIDKKRMRRDLDYANSFAPDAVIVILHFGKEYLRYPDAYQKDIVSFSFLHGADIVLGGHPHVIQPYEIKKVKDIYGIEKKRLVIYSLGNFVSGQQRRYTDGGIIFNIVLAKNKNQESKQKILFSKVYHDPVWVYLEQSASRQRSKFYILPVKEYLKSTQQLSIQLNIPAYLRMKEFYEDTQTHLKESFIQSNEYELKEEALKMKYMDKEENPL